MADWFDPYRKLGQAVLRNAVSEANKSGVEREDARAFLMGGGKLVFWCQVAGIDADAVKERWRSMQTRGTNPSLHTNVKVKPKPKGGKKGC